MHLRHKLGGHRCISKQRQKETLQGTLLGAGLFSSVLKGGGTLEQIQSWLVKFFAGIDSTYHSFFSKVYSHCSDKLGVKLAVCVLIKEAGFSHARITQRQEFDEVIVLPIRHSESFKSEMQT